MPAGLAPIRDQDAGASFVIRAGPRLKAVDVFLGQLRGRELFAPPRCDFEISENAAPSLATFSLLRSLRCPESIHSRRINRMSDTFLENPFNRATTAVHSPFGQDGDRSHRCSFIEASLCLFFSSSVSFQRPLLTDVNFLRRL